MTGNGNTNEEDITLAGEYALHLLDAADRRAFEARLALEPELRALVRDWDERLSPLADDTPAIPPPADIKHRIEQELFPEIAPEKPGLWGWLTGVRAAMAMLVMLAILIGGGLYLNQPEPVSHTARIAATDSSVIFNAQYQHDSRRLNLRRETGAARPGRVFELWLIADGADQPLSLGVLADNADTELTLASTLAGKLGGATLAISDEPAGGSPTGLPTGPVLATGSITKL